MGSYAYCRMMHGAYNVKKPILFCPKIFFHLFYIHIPQIPIRRHPSTLIRYNFSPSCLPTPPLLSLHLQILTTSPSHSNLRTLITFNISANLVYYAFTVHFPPVIIFMCGSIYYSQDFPFTHH